MDAREKLTKERLAEHMNGKPYREEMTKLLEQLAKEDGLVVVFGASDDLMEFRGAINDEVGCWDGGSAFLTNKGLLTNECPEADCSFYRMETRKAQPITALWATDDYSWVYKTDIPHATFDILEDGEKYCRGIVFALADVEERGI